MPTISWWVPRRSYARWLIRGRWAVLRTLPFRRIVLVCAVISGVLWGVCRAFYPALSMQPLAMMLVAVPALFALMAFNILILPVLIPPAVTIKHETIRFAHEQGSSWVARFGDCRRFRVVLLPGEIRRLRFRQGDRRRALGVASRVDLEALRARLPYPVRVIDARRRSGLARPRGWSRAKI